MAGRKLEVSVAADASPSLSVEYTVFIKTFLTNQLNDTGSSLAFAASRNCRLQESE
jgi:hypothetical protein